MRTAEVVDEERVLVTGCPVYKICVGSRSDSIAWGRSSAMPRRKDQHAIEGVVEQEGDQFQYFRFWQVFGFPGHSCGHADAGTALQIRTKRNVLLASHAERVVDEIHRPWRTDGSDDGGNRCTMRVNNFIANAASHPPRRTLNPDSLFVNSAIQHAIKILERAKCFIHWDRYDDGIFDNGQHITTPTVSGLCADPQGKTRTNLFLFQIQ